MAAEVGAGRSTTALSDAGTFKWIVTAAVMAVGIAVGVHFLWPTQVPDNLSLPELDPRDFFTRAQLERASDYEQFLRVVSLLSAAALVTVVAVYARHGARFVRESAAGRIGTGMLLGMLGLAFVWLAQLPFGVVALWWERRYGISKVGYIESVVGSFLGLGGVFISACLAILVAMALAAPFRKLWWLAAAPVFVAIGLGVSFLSPFLITGLKDPPKTVEADARRLERAEGLPHIRVRVQKVRKETTAPNAEAVGIGPTRRVVLWDTLLDGRFNRRQIRTVLAHELGHQKRNHILKGTAWYALFVFPAAWIVALATRRRGGIYRPEAIPLALFVVVVLQVATMPLQNVVSRRLEAEADWVSLQTTRDPSATRSTFERLAVVSRAEPDPPTWSYVLFENHPTIMQRIEMADAWQRRLRLPDGIRSSR